MPKKVPKSRAKKDKDSAGKGEPKEPKAPRGKKRKAEDETNGDAGDVVEPPEKKVRFFLIVCISETFYV